MDQIVNQIKERYPLLTRLRVTTVEAGNNSEPLPLFMGILLAAMESESKSASCFILPRREQSAHLAAIMFGLTKFVADYNRLDRQIAEKTFSPGQHVYVRPPNKIYRYLGVYPDDPAFIKLGIIGKTDWRTFPLSDVRRLEATEKDRPPGKLGNILRLSQESSFDRLMEVNTAGNFAAFLNHVLLLDYQNDFETLAQNTCLQKLPPLPDMPPLWNLMPLGSISQPENGESARLKIRNFLNYNCEPLVAVTSSPEKMVAACRAAAPRSKVVVVNGLGLLANHIQAYDEIAETQKLVIIAEHDEQEHMQTLADRNCKFWWLGQREILMGIDDGKRDAAATTVFGPVFRSARNEAVMKIESEDCEDGLLNDIAARLVGINEAVAADTTGTTRSIVGRIYKMLNNVAGLFEPPNAEGLRLLGADLSVIRRELDRDKHWIGEPAQVMTHICGLFDSVLTGSNPPGEEKGRQLWKIFRDLHGVNALLARNASQVKQLKNWVNRFGFNAQVFSPSTVPENGNFDCVVCVAWPGGDAFQRVARRFVTSRIKVIGYAFENRWLKQCHDRLRQRPHLPGFTKTDKSEMMKDGKIARIEWPDESGDGRTEMAPLPNNASIWAFENQIRSVRKGVKVSNLILEETVEAKYVGFRGDSYAHITTGHKLPIVTDLLTAQPGTRQKTPMKEIEQLRVGDFVVFRDGGERDVIQVIADQQLKRNGHDAGVLRKRANLWAEVLRGTGQKAEDILAGLARFGPRKNLITVRNWLFNGSMIGPGLKTDLDWIAKLADSRELEKSKEEVWAAIKQIRGAHQSAGAWLTDVLLQKLPSCLGEIEENGTKINIEDVVSAWVVQVEDIGPQLEQFPRSSVNRLLWDRSASLIDDLI